MYTKCNITKVVFILHICFIITTGFIRSSFPPSFRVVAILWWFYVIILLSTYGANLIAFLAVDIRQPPFETLEQLADHPLYKLGTLGGTAWVDEMRVNFIALKKVLHNIV